MRELRLWLMGRDELTSGLNPICNLEFPPKDWEQGLHDARRPDLLLVETDGGLTGPYRDRLDRILDDCRRAAVPRLLWITGSPLHPHWLERCDKFSRIFTADDGHLEGLEAAGAWMPSLLWPAAPFPFVSGQRKDSSQRRKAVVWLGGWRPEWPEPWRERLTSVLRGAATRGLRIFQDAQMETIPADLRDCVSGTTQSAGGRRAVLSDSAMVICADPVFGSLTFSPPVLFDAIACGAAVITPHHFNTWYDFGVETRDNGAGWDLINRVDSGDATIRIIDLLLDESVRKEVTRHLQHIVCHNHTYSHRLATLASAIGYRLAPDGLDSAPT